MEDFVHKQHYRPWAGVSAPAVLREFYHEYGSLQKYPKNTAIITHGGQVKYRYFLEEGLCYYTVTFKQGRENTSAIFLSGSTISLYAGTISGSVLTLNGCTLYAVPINIFRQHVYTNAVLAELHEHQITSWLSGALLGGILNAQLEVEERIAIFLQMMAKETKAEVESGYHSVGHKISHEFISHFVSANRVTVSKTMSAWQKDRHIILHDGVIAVSADMYNADLYR